MTYRISVSERTMERLREYAEKSFHGGIGGTVGLPGRFGVTVEDIIVEMLEKEGF